MRTNVILPVWVHPHRSEVCYSTTVDDVQLNRAQQLNVIVS